jgi:hypothetical protein
MIFRKVAAHFTTSARLVGGGAEKAAWAAGVGDPIPTPRERT